MMAQGHLIPMTDIAKLFALRQGVQVSIVTTPLNATRITSTTGDDPGHPATGGFVTHCGWNSVLESVAAGVPMVTWSLSAEQFYYEKLITRVLRIGVEVGAQVGSNGVEGRLVIGKEEIKRAVAHLMDGGDEADERRRRVRELGKMAERAVEKGGSSYKDLDRLIELLKRCAASHPAPATMHK
ncbi:hypothetical protein AAC387_Pa08g0202 [Persea americana]